MEYFIYYRRSLMDSDELVAAKKYFTCVDLLSDIKPGAIVVPRYSLYPFASDQCKEILNIGSKPINSFEQHLYIADLQNYVMDLGDLTPKTWFNLHEIPENGPFVVKGETNSKKSNWLKNMFANNKREAIEVQSRLLDDTLINQQKIYVRQYVPLVQYFTGIGGIPITKEFRFFIAYGEILAGAYYWQNYVDDIENPPSVDEVPKEFLQKVINKVGNKSNFYVIDVAQTQSSDWIVVELNCGMQSGLSCNDPDTLYKNLKLALEAQNT